MNIQKLGRVGVTGFLAGLLFIQPLTARNISPSYSQIEHLRFTPSVPVESEGMIQDLFEDGGKPAPSVVGHTKQKKDPPENTSIPLIPTEERPSLPLINSPSFEFDETIWSLPDWQNEGVFKLIDTLEQKVVRLKESETVAILSAMAVLQGVAPWVAFHPGAALAVGALKYGGLYTLLHRHAPNFLEPLVPIVSRGMKSVSSFLWDHKGLIATLLVGAATYAYHSYGVREPVLYAYFNNINPIASQVYALESTYANRTLFALDSWLRVEANRDGGKFTHYMVDQLVPAAVLALVPKAVHDWGSYGIGGIATDWMLPKLPGSPIPTISDVVIRQPIEWVTAPASVQVYYSPTAASSLARIGGELINTPKLYTAATHYLNLQKFSHVNKLDMGFLLSRIQYYQNLQSGIEIKPADGKQIAVWFQDMASIDELAQKLAKCISIKDVSQIQHWVEDKPALGWRPEALAIAGSSATDTSAVPELKKTEVKQTEEATIAMHDFTQKQLKKDRSLWANLGVAAAEATLSYFGWGGRGM